MSNNAFALNVAALSAREDVRLCRSVLERRVIVWSATEQTFVREMFFDTDGCIVRFANSISDSCEIRFKWIVVPRICINDDRATIISVLEAYNATVIDPNVDMEITWIYEVDPSIQNAEAYPRCVYRDHGDKWVFCNRDLRASARPIPDNVSGILAVLAMNNVGSDLEIITHP